MLGFSGFPTTGAKVLDVGCGLGGTSRYLAQHRSATVTGITISSQQVELARKITEQEAAAAAAGTSTGSLGTKNDGKSSETPSTAPASDNTLSATPYTAFGPSAGRVRFLHLDAEQMHQHLPSSSYTHVWVTEALSHIPSHPLFFKSAFDLLAPSTPTQPSRLIIADWFRGPPDSFNPTHIASITSDTPSEAKSTLPELTAAHLATITQIEDGMLLPTLPSITSYITTAQAAGFTLTTPPQPALSSFPPLEPTTNPIDVSTYVSQTWDISWSLIASPSLWAYAISQGRDGLSFLQSFRAMRRGYAEGSLRYGVLVLEKPVGR